MNIALSDTLFDIELKVLLEAIHLRYHYDFRHYATASLKRRLHQAIDRFGCRTLSGLQERVLREPEVFRELLSYLTVQVSTMFRDPSAFAALRGSVFSYLKTYASVKVWVAGCSTGEEVYSMAILLREEGLLDKALIYATDINPEALRRAEAGIYDINRVAEFSAAYREAGGRGSLSDYYTAGYGSVVFDATLRKHVLFSDHSLATDSVFAEVHLVTCRNVLIYFDPALQSRAVGLFRDSLVHKGFLALGARETLRFTSHAEAFAPYVPADRIYQRR